MKLKKPLNAGSCLFMGELKNQTEMQPAIIRKPLVIPTRRGVGPVPALTTSFRGPGNNPTIRSYTGGLSLEAEDAGQTIETINTELASGLLEVNPEARFNIISQMQPKIRTPLVPSIRTVSIPPPPTSIPPPPTSIPPPPTSIPPSISSVEPLRPSSLVPLPPRSLKPIASIPRPPSSVSVAASIPRPLSSEAPKPVLAPSVRPRPSSIGIPKVPSIPPPISIPLTPSIPPPVSIQPERPSSIGPIMERPVPPRVTSGGKITIPKPPEQIGVQTPLSGRQPLRKRIDLIPIQGSKAPTTEVRGNLSYTTVKEEESPMTTTQSGTEIMALTDIIGPEIVSSKRFELPVFTQSLQKKTVTPTHKAPTITPTITPTSQAPELDVDESKLNLERGSYTVPYLREIVKKLGLRGYSAATKPELVRMIREALGFSPL